MATSRTGTARWKKLVASARWLAQQAGQERCPYCGVVLDYVTSKLPNSAEGDHIVPHASGGIDTIENVEIICRRCNQSKGNRPQPRTIVHAAPLRNSGRWS